MNVYRQLQWGSLMYQRKEDISFNFFVHLFIPRLFLEQDM